MRIFLRNNIHKLLVWLLALTFLSCNYSYISEELIIKLINNPTTIIIDVRPRVDFEKEHIPYSINIPLEDLPNSLQKLNMYTDIIFVCRGGNKSTQAVEIVKDIGGKKFYNGGDWHRIDTILKTRR